MKWWIVGVSGVSESSDDEHLLRVDVIVRSGRM